MEFSIDRDTTDQQNITDNINNTSVPRSLILSRLKKIFIWSSPMDLLIIITKMIVLPM